MLNVLDLTGYTGSNDYDRLVELAKKTSVICILDSGASRDVAKTQYLSRGNEELWSVSSRGMGYIGEMYESDFIRKCQKLNLVFIEPNKVSQ